MANIDLVLLPGMDGTGLLFEPFVNALPSGITPIVVAYPTGEPLSYKELIPRVMSVLPEKNPFVLLGESFSGPLALMAASACRPNLRAVILVVSFVRNPVSWLPKWTRVLATERVFRFSRLFIKAKALLAGYSTPSLLGLLDKAHGMVHPAVMAIRAREILTVNVAAELRQCPVPVLYLQGANDRVVPAHNLDLIRRIRPDVQSWVVPGPHLLLQTRPQESATAICEMLRTF